ncbi:MAG: PQQ-dependent sugar dehydrogenase, partial [Deltaproteobacteria bacterium]|nr:PQQ-dependent sugar dehydrogenase [Nannocystaceae bacterium]
MTYHYRPLLPLLCLLACGDDGGSAASADSGSSSSSAGTNPTTTQSTTATTTSASSATADTSSSSGSVDSSSSASSSSGPGSSGSESSSSSGETGGPGVHYDCSAPDGEPPALELVPWLTDIAMPSGMALDPVDPDRVYVRELTGQVHVVQDGVVLPELFLDLSDEEVYCCGNDTGFGGMAMHPNYADNGLFYVHYTSSEGETRLMEYRRSDGDPDVADPDPVRELIVLGQTDVWHYGGTIEFGSDGLLYYSRGDGGGGGDPEGDAQNPLSQLGKVLRLDVDTFPVAPSGNMPEADPFVWSMGLRNVWRMAFDPCTDDLYLGDVGQYEYEEISLEPGGSAHHIFGW